MQARLAVVTGWIMHPHMRCDGYLRPVVDPSERLARQLEGRCLLLLQLGRLPSRDSSTGGRIREKGKGWPDQRERQGAAGSERKARGGRIREKGKGWDQRERQGLAGSERKAPGGGE